MLPQHDEESDEKSVPKRRYLAPQKIKLESSDSEDLPPTRPTSTGAPLDPAPSPPQPPKKRSKRKVIVSDSDTPAPARQRAKISRRQIVSDVETPPPRVSRKLFGAQAKSSADLGSGGDKSSGGSSNDGHMDPVSEESSSDSDNLPHSEAWVAQLLTAEVSETTKGLGQHLPSSISVRVGNKVMGPRQRGHHSIFMTSHLSNGLRSQSLLYLRLVLSPLNLSPIH